MKKFVLIALMAVTLVGCSSDKEENAPAASAPVTVTKTAGEIAQAMKSSIPEITTVTVWTEENDPNTLLGRPNQYTSAASMADKRVPKGESGVDAGATVEVFATAEDAQQRADYIAGIKQGGVLGTEYHTLIGTALLRVTGTLTPTVNTAYAAAFKEAVK